MSTAQARPGYNPGTQSLEQWMTDRLRADPRYQLPSGWEIHNGEVRRQGPSNWDKALMYGAPAAGFGIAGAGTIAALAGVGGAGAAGGLASGGVPVTSGIGGTVLPGTAVGITGGGAASVLPAAMTAPAAAGGGKFTIGSLLKNPDVVSTGISSGIGALTNIYGTRAANSANQRAAQAQADANRYAADLTAKGNEAQLAFLKEQEAARMREWQLTQDRNEALYNAETAREQGRYDDTQARLAPFRAFGVGAIGQLGRPIPGSIGTMVGR